MVNWKTSRDALANNAPDKERLRVYAEKFGVRLPADFDIYSLRKRGSMRQWVITPIDESRELFRIRQFDSQQSVIAQTRWDPEFVNLLTPRERERHANSLEHYSGFTNKTLIYEAKPRNPIWSKKSWVPFQLFAGRPHDMPQMVNWASMNPHADPRTRDV